MSELAFQSATNLARMIREKQISSVELLEFYFHRIDEYNPGLNAIIWQMRDEAMDSAQRADKRLASRAEVGPLHGVPMTIKESYDVVGTPSTWGIPDLKDNFPKRDALSVQRLKNAGAVIMGKTNVPLRLSDFQSYNDIYGTTNNPWDRERIPGGSSGGSAATLAAGLSGIDSGSDIGGSIRNPAHFCGIFGHKPTWNLLPPRGHATPGILSPSDLSVIGPMARSAEDLELAVKVMAGPDEIQSRGLSLDLPSLSKPPSEWQVAVWQNDPIAPVDKLIEERVLAVADTLDKLGASIDYEARPFESARNVQTTYQCLLNATMSCRLPDADYAELVERVENQASESASNNGDVRANQLRISQVARFRDWIQFNEERTHLRWDWHEFFKKYDVVIAPIMASAAFPHDHRPMWERSIIVNGEEQSYFTQLFWAGLAVNVYLPSTVIPTGLSGDGLPAGVQIIGPEYGDLMTIDMAKVLEREGYSFIAPPDYR
ncbi:MAG: amidase [Gammaproteobacteria bacterium]|nr:amidase [Gammaproteobacteria bacterium]